MEEKGKEEVVDMVKEEVVVMEEEEEEKAIMEEGAVMEEWAVTVHGEEVLAEEVVTSKSHKASPHRALDSCQV